jgi:protein involved in polysaccharide export with SLBB domain
MRTRLVVLVVAWLASVSRSEGQLVQGPRGTTKAPAPTAEKTDRIQPGDRLHIDTVDLLPNVPLKGVFRVEPSGKVALGPVYGRVVVARMTLDEAEAAIRKRLAELVMHPHVCVTRYDPLPTSTDPARGLALEARVRELEKQVRALREAVEKLGKKRGN